jgi:hypothetical protein
MEPKSANISLSFEVTHILINQNHCMGRSQETFNKKEREKKKQKKKKDKAERREQRKLDALEGRNKQPQFMYLDEEGNLVDTPPDPLKKKVEFKLEDIEISVPKQGKGEGQDDHRRKGIVKFFNREKGYGFINERGARDSIFVHMDGLIDQIKENDKVVEPKPTPKKTPPPADKEVESKDASVEAPPSNEKTE